MTPHQIWQFTRRWLWLFAAATLLASAASYVVSSRLPRVYEGTAKLLVTPGQAANGNASYNDVLTAERLTRTYSEVLKTRPVVEAAAQQAGISLPYESAAALLDVKPVRDTQLIQVTARAYDPALASAFANALATVFIQQTQASQSGRFAASKESLGKQVDLLATEIADRTRQVDALRAVDPSAARDGDLARVQSELSQLQQSYSTAVRSFEDVRMSEARSSDLLALVEPASPSTTPVQPRVVLNVALAGLVGLLLAVGGAFLLDYLDDRLLSAERLGRFTGLHVLGSVSVLPKGAPRAVDQMPATAQPADGYGASQAAEAFRLLGANLQFASVERALRALLVTSCDAGDGKTTTAANLAIVAAQAGQRVLLVDADLRRPSLHQLFGMTNRTGLTSLLVDEKLPPQAALGRTRIEGLRLLASGPLPPNPSELLASQRMRNRLAQLRDLADLIIIDSPPVRPVSDPAVLASLVDGTVLVVNAQRTRGGHAGQAVATLQKAGAHVLGAVLNRTARSDDAYYGYYSKQPQPSQPVATASS